MSAGTDDPEQRFAESQDKRPTSREPSTETANQLHQHMRQVARRRLGGAVGSAAAAGRGRGRGRYGPRAGQGHVPLRRAGVGGLELDPMKAKPIWIWLDMVGA